MKHQTISSEIISRAIEVHTHLGPGLLESAYEECMAYEFTEAGLLYVRQSPVSLMYKDIKLTHAYRMDFLVEDKIVVELKSVEALAPIHEAQMLTYLRFAKKDVGLLINFNVRRLKEGLKRYVL